jgi:sulfofructose kinase
MKLVCIGNLFLDRVYRVRDLMAGPCKVASSSVVKRGGGPAPTAAIAAARMGVETAFWGRVGDDAEGQWLKHSLAVRGVDVSGIVVCPKASTSCSSIMVDPSGERQILAYTDPAMEARAEKLPFDMLDTDTFILSDMRWLSVMPRVMDEAERLGIPVLLDVDVVSEDRCYMECVRRASYVICAELGLRKLVGLNETREALLELGRRCKGVVAATRGDKGSLWNVSGNITHVPSFSVSVADSTGAGDVFHGALAAGLALGKDLSEAVRMASAASAILCRNGRGWDGIPSMDEVRAFLQQQGYMA